MKNSKLVRKLLDNPDFLLNGILLGNLVVNVTATACATILTHNIFTTAGVSENIVYSIDIIAMTFILLVIGEITPKIFSVEFAEKVSTRVARLLQVWLMLAGPLITATTFLSSIVKGIFKTDHSEAGLTADELKTMVNATVETGEIEPEESDIIHNVFSFRDTSVKEVMVPRLDMVCTGSISVASAIKLVRESEHSRIPIYKHNTDNIIGIMYAKDLLAAKLNLQDQKNVEELMHKPYFVPESKKIDDMLKEFRIDKIQIAIVVDEYGGTSGLVTMEDILEELVGEIQDEYDEEEPLYSKLNENVYLIKALMDIDDMNRLLGTEIKTEGFETLGGLIFKKLGRIPHSEEELYVGGLRLVVKKITGRRIVNVRVERIATSRARPTEEGDKE